MGRSRLGLLALLLVVPSSGCDSEGEPEAETAAESGAKEDGLADFDGGVEVNYKDVLYICDASIADERCNNAWLPTPERHGIPAEFFVPSDVEKSETLKVLVIDTHELRILAPADKALDLEISGTFATPLSTYGFELAYRTDADEAWRPAMPPSNGHWRTARIRPRLGVVEGQWRLCSKGECEHSIDGVSLTAEGDVIEFRVGAIPISNFGKFNEGRYVAKVTVQSG